MALFACGLALLDEGPFTALRSLELLRFLTLNNFVYFMV